MDYINAAIYGAIFAAVHYGAHSFGFDVTAVTVVVFVGFIAFHELAERHPLAK